MPVLFQTATEVMEVFAGMQVNGQWSQEEGHSHVGGQ